MSIELLQQAYNSFKVRLAAFEAWRGGRSGYPSDSVPAELRTTNDEQSACELYEWLENPPDKYFLYISQKTGGCPRFGDFIVDGAQTWTGTPLGNVRFGREYRDSFGGARIPVTVYGNNGVHYAGTYYRSAGSYARIRKLKRKSCGPNKGTAQ
jgi:hypothetical protein